jgi:cobalt-zinc-cadmium efflux system membrane fusion protein
MGTIMTNRNAQAGFAAALMAMLLITGCSPKSDNTQTATSNNIKLTPEQRRNVKLYTVAVSKFRGMIDTTGVVDFDNDQATIMLAPFSGPVSRLLVSPGEQVKKGDPLAEVASPDFAAAIGTYRKAIATAQNSRRLADLDKDILDHQGISRREEEQAQTDAAGAEADRDAARQALLGLDVDPGTISDVEAGRPAGRIAGTIRAPISGTVVEKNITPGQLLQAGTTPVFTVADLSKVWVMAHVFDTDLASVHTGDLADVTTTTRTVSGTVDNIAAEVDPNTRSVTVRVLVNNPGDYLKKQMYVGVRIRDRQESSGLLVPVSAVLRDDENLPFVYITQSDGGFARQRVTLGSRTGDQYIISGGIRAGQQIVVDGAIFVQFMQNQ